MRGVLMKIRSRSQIPLIPCEAGVLLINSKP